MKKNYKQNRWHATIDNKKTLCGLSNQYKDAATVNFFRDFYRDVSYRKYYCQKCAQIIINNNLK